ncbi:MAG: biotin transporter BioY [Oscillospiraceae bacterium]
MQAGARTRTLALAALMAALLAVLAPVTVPVGPVPITLATFAVFLAGAMLPPTAAAASMATYLLLGAVGLPVFSGYRGGLQVLVGPTGGYLWGYFVVAVVLALAVRRTQRFWLRFAAAMAGMAGCYLLGSVWYMVVTGTPFWSAVALCVVPFVLPDMLKALLALALAQRLRLAGRREG